MTQVWSSIVLVTMTGQALITMQDEAWILERHDPDDLEGIIENVYEYGPGLIPTETIRHFQNYLGRTLREAYRDRTDLITFYFNDQASECGLSILGPDGIFYSAINGSPEEHQVDIQVPKVRVPLYSFDRNVSDQNRFYYSVRGINNRGVKLVLMDRMGRILETWTVGIMPDQEIVTDGGSVSLPEGNLQIYEEHLLVTDLYMHIAEKRFNDLLGHPFSDYPLDRDQEHIYFVMGNSTPFRPVERGYQELTRPVILRELPLGLPVMLSYRPIYEQLVLMIHINHAYLIGSLQGRILEVDQERIEIGPNFTLLIPLTPEGSLYRNLLGISANVSPAVFETTLKAEKIDRTTGRAPGQSDIFSISDRETLIKLLSKLYGLPESETVPSLISSSEVQTLSSRGEISNYEIEPRLQLFASPGNRLMTLVRKDSQRLYTIVPTK